MSLRSASRDEIEQGLSHFFGLSSAGLARACDLIVEADRGQFHLADGSPNLAQWLSARYGLAHSTARRLIETARRLADLPMLRERFAEGVFSFDQVEAISRMATADTEEGLIEEALGLTVAGLERTARRSSPPSKADEMKAHADRYLYIQRTLDGVQGRLRAALPGGELDVVESAIKARADRAPINPETGVFDPYPSRLADGLVELCATTGNEERIPPQVTIHADLEALTATTGGISETELGSLLANDTARRLSCDSIVECAVFYRNQPLGIGRRSRVVPRWLRRQVLNRDGGCRFPGCGRTTWVHAHHILHWSQGGPTDLDNLILLCGFHHRFLHEHGWEITGNPNDHIIVHKPDGRVYPPQRPELHPRLKELVSI